MQKKRRNGRTSTKTSVEDEIAHLRGLNLKGLRSRWQSVFQRSAPAHLTRHLLFAISPSARTACAFEPILPVAPLDGLVEIPRLYAVRGTDLLNLFFGPVRDARRCPPILVEKMETRRQTLFWTLEKEIFSHFIFALGSRSALLSLNGCDNVFRV
jgi:hypothetical protein